MSGRRFTARDAIRIIRALPVAYEDEDGPDTLLSDVADIVAAARALEAECVARCLHQGMTMAGIADHLRVSRQNIHQRFGHLHKRHVEWLESERQAAWDQAVREHERHGLPPACVG